MKLANKLNAMALAHHMPDAGVIVADPSWLGHRRQLYHAELQRRTSRALPKTMVRASPHDLAATLSKP